jgi:hypothetical protein
MGDNNFDKAIEALEKKNVMMMTLKAINQAMIWIFGAVLV